MHAPEIVHVPYRGGGQLMTELVSNQIQMIAQSVTGQVIELNRTGKLRVLAVTSPARLIGAPDIPTAVEAGLPGMVSQNFICRPRRRIRQVKIVVSDRRNRVAL